MPSLRKFDRRPLALGLLLALFWSALSLGGVLARPEWVLYHSLFEWRGPQPKPTDISVVAIDEPTLQDFEVWPPPRTVYAELIDGLVAAGAAVIAIDVVFPQAQSSETDAALRAALERHPGKVVLAANFQPVVSGPEEGETLVLPAEPFREAATYGYVNLMFDADGAIHRAKPYHAIELPGLPERLESFDAAAARLRGGALPDWLGQRDDFLINYAGPPGYFPHASFTKVLDAIREGDRAYLAQFRGDVVLVGATSVRMQDQYPTPYTATALGGGAATYMPGVEIHANVVNTIVRSNPLHRIPREALVGLLLFIGFAGSGLFSRIKPWWGVLGLFVSSLTIAGAGVGLFVAERLWLDLAAPLFLLATLYTAAVIEHFTRAETTRRFYRQTFERYVHPDIVGEILRNPGLAPKLGGERREVSVLFSDIRSFTTISEQLTPEEVVEFLNAYLSAMADVIDDNEGCIDKYIGDAILALWGNVKPMTKEEAATYAVRSALGMKARVEALQPEWQARGFPHIEIGVGINTGDAIVGNIGSPRKLEFGVIGDAINVASRLEGLTKDYGGAILISDRTRELIGERFVCTYLDAVKVKGREQPVKIYRVDREHGA